MNTEAALNEAIKQVAQAKVAEALSPDILGTMIQAVMDHKDRSYNSSDKEQTTFEKLVNEQIKNSVRLAVTEYISENSAAIKDAVKRSMRTGGLDKLATNVVDAFASNDWRANLEIKLDRD